jgi:hypothetical protein
VTDVLIAIAVTGTIFIAVGAPFAFSIRSSRDGWIPLVTDSAGFGLVIVPLSIVAWSLVGWWGIAGAAIVVIAFGLLAWRARVGLPSRPIERPPVSLTISWVVVSLVALLLRIHDVNFLPWVGDMGAYVNWSNEFVRTGELSATWPPIYSSFLSLSTAIFGTSGTASGIAITGIVLIAVMARVLNQLVVNRWIVLGLAGAVTFNIHAIWYSTFPSSESLNAPMFLIWVSMLIVTVRSSRAQLPAAAGLTFIVMLHLCLLRGSVSFLLVPALLLAIAAITIPAWRSWGPRIWIFFVASLIAAEVGVWYGVSVIPRYFVDTQLRMLAPGSIFAWGKDIGLFSPGPLLLAVLIAMTAAASLGLRFARRHPEAPRNSRNRVTAVLSIAAAIALAGVLIFALLVGSNIWAIFWRSGIWIALIPILTLTIVSRRTTVREDVPVLFLLMSTSLMLIAFHSFRVGNDRIHAFFLYWDRYLYSEVIPAMLVMSGVGLSALASWAASRWTLPTSRATMFAPVGITALAIAIVTAPHAEAVSRIASDTYMAGAYEFTRELSTDVAESDAVFWGATSPDAAPGFFFPNTWMAFAVPLERTFGLNIPNVDQGNDNFSPDDVITENELDAALESSDIVYVFETQTEIGEPLNERVSSDLSVTSISDRTSNISLLPQGPGLAPWSHANIRVITWTVSRAG